MGLHFQNQSWLFTEVGPEKIFEPDPSPKKALTLFNFQLRIFNFRIPNIQIPNFQIPNFQFLNFKFRISNSNFKSQIFNPEFQFQNFKLNISISVKTLNRIDIIHQHQNIIRPFLHIFVDITWIVPLSSFYLQWAAQVVTMSLPSFVLNDFLNWSVSA